MAEIDAVVLGKAAGFAADAHKNQTRKRAEGDLRPRIPYISHLLAVCGMVIEDGADTDEAVAGLLHDYLEDVVAQGNPTTLEHGRIDPVDIGGALAPVAGRPAESAGRRHGQAGAYCGICQLVVVGDQVIGSEPDGDGKVDRVIGPQRCVCARRDHVASREIDEIDGVEDDAHGFEVDVLGVATCRTMQLGVQQP